MIILISSPMPRSGKDTVAEYLEKEYGFYRTAFADPLKELCVDYFKWDGVKDTKGRNFIIGIAQAVKNIDPYFWVKKTYEQIKRKDVTNRDIVISDLRFEEELWILSQPEFTNEKKVIIGVERGDKTPKGVSQVDYLKIEKDVIIDNSKDFNHLFNQVDILIENTQRRDI